MAEKWCLVLVMGFLAERVVRGLGATVSGARDVPPARATDLADLHRPARTRSTPLVDDLEDSSAQPEAPKMRNADLAAGVSQSTDVTNSSELDPDLHVETDVAIDSFVRAFFLGDHADAIERRLEARVRELAADVEPRG